MTLYVQFCPLCEVWSADVCRKADHEKYMQRNAVFELALLNLMERLSNQIAAIGQD